jgi:hypothetical protein
MCALTTVSSRTKRKSKEGSRGSAAVTNTVHQAVAMKREK